LPETGLAEETLSSRRIYDGRAVSLRVDTVRLPSGRETTREVVEHEECVAVVAVDDKDNVLLVRQYRHPVEKELLEIVAGGIDPGESPEDAVRREMREETGFLPKKVEKLGGFYSAPGYSNEYLYLYLAADLVSSPLRAEDTENISLVRVPLEQVTGLIASGAITDAKSIAGLLAYLDYRKSAQGVG
jgi:ADP-ribose pyrophosphatase